MEYNSYMSDIFSLLAFFIALTMRHLNSKSIKNTEADLNNKIQNNKYKLEQSLEKTKSDLYLHVKNYHLKFSKLYEKQMTVIAECYQLLSKVSINIKLCIEPDFLVGIKLRKKSYF